MAGNENTISSLLSARFGFPFANATMPGGNSRNLFSLLLDVIARAPRPPAVVVHFSGGDYSTFCVSSIADLVYGSPNRMQLERATKERRGAPDPDRNLPQFLAFTGLWTRAIGDLCRAHSIRLVLGNDVTFFEKSRPGAIEQECDLGRPRGQRQEKQFANHRRYGQDFYGLRRSLSKALDAPLVGSDVSDHLTFIDEFHPDRDGTRVIADQLAEVLEPML